MSERWSPFDIRLLLHFYYNPERHPDRPAYRQAVARFLELGVIAEKDDTYTTTDRGNFWVEMICNTPPPVTVWMDPRESKIS